MRRTHLLVLAAVFGLVSIAGDQLVYQIEKMINRLEQEETRLEDKLNDNIYFLTTQTQHHREAFFDLNHAIVLWMGNVVQKENHRLKYVEFRKRLHDKFAKDKETFEEEERKLWASQKEDLEAEFREHLITINRQISFYVEDIVAACDKIMFSEGRCTQIFINSVKIRDQNKNLNLIESAELKLDFYEKTLIDFQRDIEDINRKATDLNKQISKKKLARQLFLIATLIFNLLSLIAVFLYFRQIIMIGGDQKTSLASQ